jgi:hypothetical protein
MQAERIFDTYTGKFISKISEKSTHIQESSSV